jgi:hypothetical protein
VLSLQNYGIGIYSLIQGPEIVNGKKDFSNSLILIITSAAKGNEHHIEKATHTYPIYARNAVFLFPKKRAQIQCTKSSVVIAAACHQKNSIMPRVRSLRVMFVGDGSMSIEAACIIPEMVNAAQSWVYEDKFVPRWIFSPSTRAPVNELRVCRGC